MKFLNKKKFAKIVLDENFKLFIMHITAVKTLEMTIYLLQIAQILNSNFV